MDEARTRDRHPRRACCTRRTTRPRPVARERAVAEADTVLADAAHRAEQLIQEAEERAHHAVEAGKVEHARLVAATTVHQAAARAAAALREDAERYQAQVSAEAEQYDARIRAEADRYAARRARRGRALRHQADRRRRGLRRAHPRRAGLDAAPLGRDRRAGPRRHRRAPGHGLGGRRPGRYRRRARSTRATSPFPPDTADSAGRRPARSPDSRAKVGRSTFLRPGAGTKVPIAQRWVGR